MGVIKEPTNIQDEDAEVSSSMEEDLMSEQEQDDSNRRLLSKQDQEDVVPMPIDQYLKLRFRSLCPHGMGQMVLMAVGFVACVMLVVVVVHQCMKPSVNLRVPQPESQAPVHYTSPASRTNPTPTLAPMQEKPLACNYREVSFCPARSLFQSPEIHRIVTDNLMRTNSRLLTQADYEIVQEFAWSGFKKINAELEVRAPMVAAELEKAQLSSAQKNAVLDLLALLSDPSVQTVGYDVAMIIRNTKFTTRKYLKYNIEDSLNPMDEIQKLAHEIIPQSVIALWGKGGHDWEMTLEPRNIESMRTDHMKMPANLTGVDFETKSLSIYAAVLQVGRVLLDIMKIHIRSMGPSWSTALHDTMGPLIEGIVLPNDRPKHIFMEAFLWPLKCGAQGLDALRASVSAEYGHEFKR